MTCPPHLRVLVPGGILSPADLLEVLAATQAAGSTSVSFGPRQEILFPVSDATGDPAAATRILDRTGLPWDRGGAAGARDGGFVHQNLVSSYAAANVTEGTWWLKENVYQRTLDAFDPSQRLAVNLVDPRQQLVPLFTGQLNFVASQDAHLWDLYLRFDGSPDRLERWPHRIHEENLAALAQALTERWPGGVGREAGGHPANLDVEALSRSIAQVLPLDGPKPTEGLALPTRHVPEYEGMQPMPGNRFWLGLHRRDHRFEVDFLRAACSLCQDTRVGKVCFTPWGTLMIKGIRLEDRTAWHRLTGRHGVNLRHSGAEVPWQVPTLDEAALDLKTYLVAALDRFDAGTHGLTFGIRENPDTPAFASILIDRALPDAAGTERFNLRHSDDFDPRGLVVHTFAENMARDQLLGPLLKMVALHFRDPDRGHSDPVGARLVPPESRIPRPLPAVEAPVATLLRHQCSDCLTIYDPNIGDPDADVPENTPFTSLPPTYVCSLCSGERERFVPL